MRKESFFNTPINAVIVLVLILIAGFTCAFIQRYISDSNAYKKGWQEAFYECTNLSKTLYCVDTTSKTKYCLYDNYECVIITDNIIKFQCQSLQTQDQYWFNVL